LLALALMSACVVPTRYALALDAQELLSEFARKKQGHASFVETKYLAILDRPVTSSGTLSFAAPSRIEKITLEPKPESLILDGQELRLIRDGKALTVDLQRHAEVQSFVQAIRGVLMGDLQLLQNAYLLQLSGAEQNWELQLVPRDARLGEVIKQIKIGGGHGQVRRIEYLQRDGDRTVMNIDPAPEGEEK
jgi:hypothetical protein